MVPRSRIGFVECNQPWNRPLLLKCARGSGSFLRGISWIDSISSSAFRLNAVKHNGNYACHILYHQKILTSFVTENARWDSRLRHCATSRVVAVSILLGVFGIFHRQTFRPHCGPRVDSASNRKEYQEYFLGSNDGWCQGLYVLIVLKSGSLNLLEPSGPVQAYIGIALLLSQKRALIFPTALTFGLDTACTLRYVEFLLCWTNKYLAFVGST